MADNISDILGSAGKAGLDYIESSLTRSKALIIDINKTGIRLEAGASGITNLKQLSDMQAAMVENSNKLSQETRNYQILWKNLLNERDALAKKAADEERQLAKMIASEQSAINKKVKEEERELNRLIAAEQRVLDAQSRAEKKAAIAERKQADRDYQSTWKALLNERDQLSAAQEAKRKKAAADAVMAVAGDSNVGLRKTLSDLTYGYDRLTKAERDNAEIGGVLQARIMELNKSLVASETGTGRYGRVVGNYATGFNGLGFAIKNIAGELPNLGISIRTFAQSISNNIGPLSDAISQVREQNKLLQAEGKPTVSVGKQIAQSIFSWQTAILAVVAAGVFLVDYLAKGNKATQEAEKINKKYTESIKSIEESSRSSAQEEIAHENVLVTIAKDRGQRDSVRLRAVKELQDTYPQTFGLLTKQAILEGQLGDAVDKTTKALLNRAAAQAAEKKFGAASEKVFDLTEARSTAINDVIKAQAKFDQLNSVANANPSNGFARNAAVTAAKALESQTNALYDLSDAYDKARAEQLKYLDDAKAFSQQAGDVLFTGKDKPAKTGRDTLNQQIKAESDFTKAYFGELKNRALIEADNAQLIYQNDQLSLKKRIDAYNDYTIARLEAAGYETAAESHIIQDKLDRIAAIEKKAAKDRTNEEKNLLREKAALQQQQLNVVAKYDLEQTKLINDNAAFRADAAVREIKRVEAEAAKAQKNLDDLSAFAKKNGKSQTREDYDKERQKKEDYYARTAVQTANYVADINSSLSQKKINELDKEIAAINKKRDAEIDAVGKTTLTEQEKERKVAEIKAQSAQKTDELEAKKRDRLKRTATFEKFITVGQIIAETALATVRALGSKPYTPANIGLAYATAAIGLIQVGAALAAPIPQYAEGTDDHIGGKALVGEGKKHGRFVPELVQEPGKAPFVVTQPTVLDLAKHATVKPLSSHEMIAMTYGMTMNGMGIMPVATESKGIDMSAQFDKLGRRIVNAIDRQQGTTLHGVNTKYDKYIFQNIKS